MATIQRSQPASRTFSYAEVETALAKMFDATDVQRSAFRGRIQHFRKCGLPQKRVGKGARVRYSAADVFQLMLAFEFAEFGVDPRLIIQIIRRHWRLQIGLWQAIANIQTKIRSDDLHVMIETHMMSWTWNREKFKQTATEITISSVGEPIAVGYFWADESDVLLKRLQERGTRFFVFNLSERVRTVEEALRKISEE